MHGLGAVVRIPYSRPRLRGLHGGGVVVSAPDSAGNITIDDGAGNIVVQDASGMITSYKMKLGGKVGWLQPPVYIAVGLGLAIGALAMKFMGKGKK